jgi:hypothetical protein
MMPPPRESDTLESLRAVTASLDAEIAALEAEYAAALQSAQASLVHSPTSCSGSGSGSGAGTGGVMLSPKLSALIEQLERKGQQMFLLKRYEDDVRSGRQSLESVSSLNSPEARRHYQRKVQSLRLLGDLRKLMD